MRFFVDGDKPIIAVEVLFSEAEYHRLRRMVPLTAEGTIRNVVRGLLKMQPTPVGYVKLRNGGSGYRVVTAAEYEERLRKHV